MPGGTRQLRLWQIAALIAAVALLLAPAVQLEGATLWLYLSTVSLVVPWGLFSWARRSMGRGLARMMVLAGLFALPMPLTLGLLEFSRPLGPAAGPQGIGDMSPVAPAFLFASFAVLFVGPWLCAFTAWDIVGPKVGGVVGSPIAKVLACLSAMALLAAALRFPGFLCPIALLATFGYGIALKIRESDRPSSGPSYPKPGHQPELNGYVPRADGDDPFF